MSHLRFKENLRRITFDNYAKIAEELALGKSVRYLFPLRDFLTHSRFTETGISVSANQMSPQDCCVHKNVYRIFLEHTKDSGFACYFMSLLYDYGWGVEEDLSQVFHWAQKSSDQGCSYGIVSLGWEHGLGCSADREKAMRLYEKAADQGNSLGMFNTGVFHANFAVEWSDQTKAAEYYQKASENGHRIAMYQMSLKQPNSDWLLKAAQRGHEHSILKLAATLPKEAGIYWELRGQDLRRVPFKNTRFVQEEWNLQQSKMEMEIKFEEEEIKFRPEKRRILLIARYKEPSSVFYYEVLPNELFVEIFKFADLFDLTPYNF